MKRFAYADPPYLGTGSGFGAAHHYGKFHPDANDCDTPEWHQKLIDPQYSADLDDCVPF